MSIRLRVTHLLNFLVSCPWMYIVVFLVILVPFYTMHQQTLEIPVEGIETVDS